MNPILHAAIAICFAQLSGTATMHTLGSPHSYTPGYEACAKIMSYGVKTLNDEQAAEMKEETAAELARDRPILAKALKAIPADSN